MPLTSEQRAELERRGAQNVHILLRVAAAAGQTPTVRLNISGEGPLCQDVEAWLHEKDPEKKNAQKQYRLILRWTIAAAIFAGIGAIAVVIAGVGTP